jgi:DNA-binding winged helix-turn-helix (wHTH) protein
VHVLAHLLSHPGKVIAKNALLDTVRTDVFGQEAPSNTPLTRFARRVTTARRRRP